MSFKESQFENFFTEESSEYIEKEMREDRLMSSPEIVVEQEEGISLMSFMLKGYDPEWGDNSHELSKATNRYFEDNPISDKIRESLDDLAVFKKDGIDQETLFNSALSYEYPERIRETSINLIRDKGLDSPDQLQEELLKLMKDFNDELNLNPQFLELKKKFDIKTEEDIEIRKEGLEKRKEEIDELLNFFRPKAETTRTRKIKIIPTDYLYNRESGMCFSIGDEMIVRVPLKDIENGQWTHEFLHGVINPISDKLFKKLTNEQKEKIVRLSQGKLRQHYGEEPFSLLNESFIRTYVNSFSKDSGRYNYEYFEKLISGINDEQFQGLLEHDKELKQRMSVLEITNFEEFSQKKREYFEKYEQDHLGNIIYGFYERYQEELKDDKKLTFGDFVLQNFIEHLEKQENDSE